jgi:hypothetical protein
MAGDWRTRAHDDLALAIAAWLGMQSEGCDWSVDESAGWSQETAK